MQSTTNYNSKQLKIRNYHSLKEKANYDRLTIEENIEGLLYIKPKGNPIKQLSDYCFISITQSNILNIQIKKNNKLLYSFPIKNNTNINKIINSSGNKCIIWESNGQFYIFEIFKNDNNEIKIINQLSNKVNDFGIIDNLNEFLDNNYNNIIFKKNINVLENINSSNQYPCKADFANSFNKYNEIYECKGMPFKYDKFSNQLIPLYKEINENAFIKIIDVGETYYLLVIEKDEKILVAVKIKDEHSIVINENYATMSFFDNNQNIIIPYNISFEDNSINEINYFKNVINRCLYETYNKLYQYKTNEKNKIKDSWITKSNSSISTIDSNKNYLNDV